MKPRQQTEHRPSQQAETEYPILDGFAESEFSLGCQGHNEYHSRADGDSDGGRDQPLSEGVERFHESSFSHLSLFARASIPALCFFAGYVLAAFHFFQPCGM